MKKIYWLMLMFLLQLKVYAIYEGGETLQYISNRFTDRAVLREVMDTPVIRGSSYANISYDNSIDTFLLNPAILGLRNYSGLYTDLNHTVNSHIDSTSFYYKQFVGYGSIATGFNFLYVYDFETTQNGVPDKKTSGRDKFLALTPSLSYGARVYEDWVFAGITVRYTYIKKMNVYEYTEYPGQYYLGDKPIYSKGLFFDVGVTAKVPLELFMYNYYGFPDIYVSIGGRNLHPKFMKPDEILEFNESFIAGVSFVYPYTMGLYISTEMERGQSAIVNVGVEISMVYFLKVRAGVGLIPDRQQTNSVTAGIGYGNNFGDTKTSLSIEYSIGVYNIEHSPSIEESNPQEIRHSIGIVLTFGTLEYNPKAYEL